MTKTEVTITIPYDLAVLVMQILQRARDEVTRFDKEANPHLRRLEQLVYGFPPEKESK